MVVWAQIWPAVWRELCPQKRKSITSSSVGKPPYLEKCSGETDLFSVRHDPQIRLPIFLRLTLKVLHSSWANARCIEMCTLTWLPKNSRAPQGAGKDSSSQNEKLLCGSLNTSLCSIKPWSQTCKTSAIDWTPYQHRSMFRIMGAMVLQHTQIPTED